MAHEQHNETRGRGRFKSDTTMREAMAVDPSLSATLMRFHIGGCTMCGFEPEDTIAKVAEDNGVPTERLLAAMNGQPAV
jgi:hypothetical protein